MKVYFDEQWVIERDNGEIVRLAWNESSMLYNLIRRKVIWDEVEMRLDDGDMYETHRAEIEAAKDDIIEYALDNVDDEIGGDVVYDAITRYVDLYDDDDDGCDYSDDTIISIRIREED